MRKTSHDGGDSTSITSGVENETKKSAMKPKKSSLKRKVPSFSQESDETVIEPLLQKDKEKPLPQSAKYFGIVKTDSSHNKESDKAKTTTTTGFCGTTESLLSFKDSESAKTTTSAVVPFHNYMNTNVFNAYDNVKANVTTKSQILVEIDSSKQNSYTPSPLIFTTAKIHTDSKTKHMEPVHVTPVPILSTIEVSISKGKNGTTNERKTSNDSPVINPVYSPMPLSKGKEEKVTVSSFSTVTSPTIKKDAFSKAVLVTSANKSDNVTVAQGSSMKIIIPPTTANSSLLMKNSAINKQGDVKDVNKEQTLQFQPKTFNSDGTKNDAKVKSITPSSGKNIDISTTSTKTSQDDKSQIQILNAVDDIQTNLSANVSSCNSQKFTSNNKTPTSEISTGISNPTKNIPSSVGNKHLQRQKPATEQTNNIKSKVNPNIERPENLSAKMTSSSHSKIIDSISIKDIPSNINANNTQTINTKSDVNDTAKSIGKITSSSTTTKPIVTNLALSNTMTAPIDVSSKHSTTSLIPNADKVTFPTTTSSNVNKVSAVSTITSSTVTKSPPQNVLTTVSVPTSIGKTKSPELSSTQTQPQTSNNKTLQEKKPVLNATSVKTTALASSGKSKAANVTSAKSPTAVTATAATKSTQNSTISKVPAITTLVKGISASSVTSVSTQPSTSTSQALSSKTSETSSSVAVVKAEALTTSSSKILSNAVSSMTTSPQNITTTQGVANKHAITVSGAITKTSSSVISVKPSTVNSSAPALSTAGIKSPNNNSSDMFEVLKPYAASIPKTESMTTSSKTSSTNVNTASIVRSPKGTSAATTITKESATSEEKSEVSKISVFTKSPPVTSTIKPIVGKTTKTSSEVSSVPIKKGGTAVFTKVGSATTTKTPSASTLTKPAEVTSSSSTTASAVAFNPATTSAIQVSANKSVGLAGSSVPSSTPVLRQSELVKKGGSKSSENNKDSKSSKA